MRKNTPRKARLLPPISTASLPDIIFLLLIFFMVSTRLRKETPLVLTNPLPQVEAAQKLARKSLVSYIYIGVPMSKENFGTAPRIQLNGQIATVEDIAAFVEAERQARHEQERELITFSLKVQKSTPMGIVHAVKEELRKAGAYKINYSSVSISEEPAGSMME